MRRALFSAQGRRPPLAPELAWAAWLAFLYDLLVGATPLQVRTAIANGFAVLRLERAWGLAGERALNRLLVGAPALKALAAYYYDNAHFIVTFGLLALLWWRRPAAYRPLRTTLVLVNLVAFCVFYLFPMAPPRLLPGAGFYDVVAESGAIGQWHTGSLARSADQYAAMPSLHIAWAVWSAAAIWALTDRRRWRAAALLYPALTALDVVATANHLFLDCLAGLATVGFADALRNAACALAAVAFGGRKERAAAFAARWVGARAVKRGQGVAATRPTRAHTPQPQMTNRATRTTDQRQRRNGREPGVCAWR